MRHQPVLEGLLIKGRVVEVDPGKSQSGRAEPGPCSEGDDAEAQE